MVRQAHFEQVRKLLAGCDCREVKTIGDAFLLAFRTAPAALDFVLALQNATGHGRVKIRAGIHVGPVHIEEDDAFSSTVNYAQRVESQAQEPEVWVSYEAKKHIDQARKATHGEIRWEEHPDCELKGFDGKHRLWSVRRATRDHDGGTQSGPTRSDFEKMLSTVHQLSEISLEKCTVVGQYRRYEEVVRNELCNWNRRLVEALLHKTQTRENFLIWAAPGSGKSFFVAESARVLGDKIEFIELNVARDSREKFDKEINRLESLTVPTLCLVDEIDKRADESWVYDRIFPLLNLNERRAYSTVFVAIGSSGGSVDGLVAAIKARKGGGDLVSRIPVDHRFSIPPLAPEDRAVVVASQLVGEAERQGRSLEQIEKPALYFILVEKEYASPRQLNDLAMKAVNRLPTNDSRIKYGDLFDRDDDRKDSFLVTHQRAVQTLKGHFVRIVK